jgi:predicted phosphodiesterase
MRVAILADIHGNLPACEAVMDDIRRQTPDFIVAAGDLALRGAHPKETVDLLFDRCTHLIIGNTDSYIAGNYLGGAYREREHWKTDLLEWTRNELGSERIAKLGNMPFSTRLSPRKGQDLFVCHANPRNLEESLEPTLDEMTVRRFLHNLDAAAVAFGHLHFPYRRRVGRVLIADVASAGIPRDGDLRPAWGLFTFTPKGWRVQIRRVRYPVRKATLALTERKVPGAPLLVHKMIEARYRNHAQLSEAARRHSGLPPAPGTRPPPPSSPREGGPADSITEHTAAAPAPQLTPPSFVSSDEITDEPSDPTMIAEPEEAADPSTPPPVPVLAASDE